MKRFRPLWRLVAIEFAALGFLLGVYYLHLPLGCPVKKFTGLPCPGCGGTRALVTLLHGHLLDALYINPLSVLLIVFAVIAPVWLFVDCYRGTHTLQRVMKGRWSIPVICIVVIIIIANWIWNIYKGI